MDLILGGNITECLPQFGRLDASYGNVLINRGKRSFVEMPPAESGITVTGMVRDIAWLPGKKENRILFLRNNDTTVMYRLNPLKGLARAQTRLVGELSKLVNE